MSTITCMYLLDDSNWLFQKRWERFWTLRFWTEADLDEEERIGNDQNPFKPPIDHIGWSVLLLSGTQKIRYLKDRRSGNSGVLFLGKDSLSRGIVSAPCQTWLDYSLYFTPKSYPMQKRTRLGRRTDFRIHTQKVCHQLIENHAIIMIIPYYIGFYSSRTILFGIKICQSFGGKLSGSERLPSGYFGCEACSPRLMFRREIFPWKSQRDQKNWFFGRSEKSHHSWSMIFPLQREVCSSCDGLPRLIAFGIRRQESGALMVLAEYEN